MTTSINIDLDYVSNHQIEPRDYSDSYWKPENFSSDSGNKYLRLEEWMQDVEEFVFPVREFATSIDITLDMARAILRYQEELKLYAAIEDQQRRESSPEKKLYLEAMKNVEFLDRRHQAIVDEWPNGKETSSWWKALEELIREIDTTIMAMREKVNNHTGNCESKDFRGVFVKLSVRSPKDSVVLLSKYKTLLKEKIDQTTIPPFSPLSLSSDIDAIRYANWKAMCCKSGEEVLIMLARSERVYLDIQHQELFCDGEKEETFKLKLHLSPFFEGFHPDYEFRGFMSRGVRTALTQYSPWLYDEKIIAHREFILQKMIELWDRAAIRIQSENYSIDFAFSEDLSQCWIIEINNFLPPLAGWGVFNYYQATDKKILLEGPFEFRIRTEPVKREDFLLEKVDERTGKVIKMIVQPAHDEIMEYVANLRRMKFHQPPITVHTSESHNHDTQQTVWKSCVIN